jgi:hypothetical protein
MTAANRVYVGEATVGASTVSSVVSYAFNGRYDSGLFLVAASSGYTKLHNIGTQTYNIDMTLADDTYGSNERPLVTYGSIAGWWPGLSSRNYQSVYTNTNVGIGTTSSESNVSSGYYRMRARRPF